MICARENPNMSPKIMTLDERDPMPVQWRRHHNDRCALRPDAVVPFGTTRQPDASLVGTVVPGRLILTSVAGRSGRRLPLRAPMPMEGDSGLSFLAGPLRYKLDVI